MKLRPSERCPLHNRYDCCGREKKRSEQKRSSGPVRKLPDGREICTPAEMRRRLGILLRKQGCMCALCLEPIADFREAQVDHKEPRGMGGARRNDAFSNIQAVHGICNMQKGSRRL